MVERLQKVLAQAGVSSRRGAEQLIREGRVGVDGRIVHDMGIKVDPAVQRITCDGKQLDVEKKIALLLYKPTGYVTTLSDPQGRAIVSDLISDVPERLFPVGRLDLDTEGALIMTNDGSLGHAILHPRFQVNKTYEALVNGLPSSAKLELLSSGIEIDGFRTSPARLRVIKRLPRQTLVEIIIHEGKKRQVKKMFQAIGHRVVHLKRTAYGGLRLGQLHPGQYRLLQKKDLEKIFSNTITLYNKKNT